MPPKRTPKPRAGRKPLPPGEARSRRIVLLVREADGEAIDRAAGSRDGAAGWAARVVLEAATKPAPCQHPNATPSARVPAMTCPDCGAVFQVREVRP